MVGGGVGYNGGEDDDNWYFGKVRGVEGKVWDLTAGVGSVSNGGDGFGRERQKEEGEQTGNE